MDTNDFGSFKELYLQTAREHIKTLHSVLIVLANHGENTKAIIEAHIAAHSLKGESFAMGNLTTSQVAHVLENLFAKAKSEGMTFSIALTEAIADALMHIDASLTNFEKEGKELDLSQESAKLTLACGISA
jgi:chemotaxis protein histidine kinase CheA